MFTTVPLLVFVLNTEERTAIADGKLRHYCNRPENLAVPSDAVAVRLLKYLSRLEAPVDCLVAIPCAGLHPLVFQWVARIVRALDLVSGANISVVSLDPLTWLEEVAEDLVKSCNVVESSGWVGTLDPYQVPPYNTYPHLVAEGRLERVLVGGEPVPRLRLSCLWDPEIGPVDGHQAVVAYVVYFLIFKIGLRLWG